MLPPVPLGAFFLLVNGGYLASFTAAGGQTIGKMALWSEGRGPRRPAGLAPVFPSCVRSGAWRRWRRLASASCRRLSPRAGARSRIVSPTHASSGSEVPDRPGTPSDRSPHDASCPVHLHVRLRRLLPDRTRHRRVGRRPGRVRATASGRCATCGGPRRHRGPVCRRRVERHDGRAAFRRHRPRARAWSTKSSACW